MINKYLFFSKSLRKDNFQKFNILVQLILLRQDNI